MRHRATSCNNPHTSNHEDDSDNDDNDDVPGNSSVGDSESESASLAEVEWHWEGYASHSGDDNEDGGVNLPSRSEEECSKEDEKVEEENEGDDEPEVHDHCASHGLQLGNSFELSKMAAAWEMFKSNPLQKSCCQYHSFFPDIFLAYGWQISPSRKELQTSSSVSGHVSGPEVNSGSNSGGQLNHPGDHVVYGVTGASDSGVGTGGGIISHVSVSGDAQARMSGSHVPPDHRIIAGSGDSTLEQC